MALPFSFQLMSYTTVRVAYLVGAIFAFLTMLLVGFAIGDGNWNYIGDKNAKEMLGQEMTCFGLSTFTTYWSRESTIKKLQKDVFTKDTFTKSCQKTLENQYPKDSKTTKYDDRLCSADWDTLSCRCPYAHMKNILSYEKANSCKFDKCTPEGGAPVKCTTTDSKTGKVTDGIGLPCTGCKDPKAAKKYKFGYKSWDAIVTGGYDGVAAASGLLITTVILAALQMLGFAFTIVRFYQDYRFGAGLAGVGLLMFVLSLAGYAAGARGAWLAATVGHCGSRKWILDSPPEDKFLLPHTGSGASVAGAGISFAFFSMCAGTAGALLTFVLRTRTRLPPAMKVEEGSSAADPAVEKTGLLSD